ncbi:hypothetical protein KOW79_001416 [Hemibagrus wyckioides]|uniref:Uncharacterized protein n=1 Tax=Hemibagrus wyckioides TaxID=337641 RepID=A0A9D3STW1_9TELE|nr:hypothetical protein KOW79_001416 [Hemibagrus wyckioides]
MGGTRCRIVYVCVLKVEQDSRGLSGDICKAGVVCPGAAETVGCGAACGVEFAGMLMQRRWCCPRRAMNGVVTAYSTVTQIQRQSILALYLQCQVLCQ